MKSQGYSLAKYDKFKKSSKSEINPAIQFIKFLEGRHNDIQKAIFKQRKEIKSLIDNS